MGHVYKRGEQYFNVKVKSCAWEISWQWRSRILWWRSQTQRRCLGAWVITSCAKSPLQRWVGTCSLFILPCVALYGSMSILDALHSVLPWGIFSHRAIEPWHILLDDLAVKKGCDVLQVFYNQRVCDVKDCYALQSDTRCQGWAFRSSKVLQNNQKP